MNIRQKIFAAGIGFAAAFVTTAASAQETAPRFFTEQKEYSDAPYVLNDYLEFSVFDMSKLNLFINSQKIDLRPTEPPPGGVAVPQTESQAEREIKAILPEIPKFFYKELKARIFKHKVPVTLFATDSPSYARPVKLYVKLKKISLAPGYTDKKGIALQPVGIKIYGQLKEKAGDKVLVRFYDAQTAEFPLGQDQAGAAFNAMAAQMMDNLARYLKTKY